MVENGGLDSNFDIQVSCLVGLLERENCVSITTGRAMEIPIIPSASAEVRQCSLHPSGISTTTLRTTTVRCSSELRGEAGCDGYDLAVGAN